MAFDPSELGAIMDDQSPWESNPDLSFLNGIFGNQLSEQNTFDPASLGAVMDDYQETDRDRRIRLLREQNDSDEVQQQYAEQQAKAEAQARREQIRQRLMAEDAQRPQPEPESLNYWDRFVLGGNQAIGGLERAAGGAIAAAPDMVGRGSVAGLIKEFSPSAQEDADSIRTAGLNIAKAGEQRLQDADTTDIPSDWKGKAVEWASRALTGLLPMAAAGAAAPALGLSQLAGIVGYAGTTAAGDAYKSSFDALKSEGADDETAGAVSAQLAAVSGAISGALFAAAGGLSGSAHGGLALDTAGNIIRTIAKESGLFGTQSAIDAGVQGALAKLTFDPHRTWLDILPEMGWAAVETGALPVLMHGLRLAGKAVPARELPLEQAMVQAARDAVIREYESGKRTKAQAESALAEIDAEMRQASSPPKLSDRGLTTDQDILDEQRGIDAAREAGEAPQPAATSEPAPRRVEEQINEERAVPGLPVPDAADRSAAAPPGTGEANARGTSDQPLPEIDLTAEVPDASAAEGLKGKTVDLERVNEDGVKTVAKELDAHAEFTDNLRRSDWLEKLLACLQA